MLSMALGLSAYFAILSIRTDLFGGLRP